MTIPKITRKEAERVVKKYSFKIDKGRHYSKKRIKKANKFEKKHGFRYEDVWNLDNAIACFILPRLVQLRDIHHGVPHSFVKGNAFEERSIEEADKKWTETLDKIIYGFYLYITKELYEMNKEEKELFNEAISLFKEVFTSLWD